MSKWPAVDVTPAGDPDLILAIVDDFSPSAAEHRESNLRLFFPTATARDAAGAALSAARYRAEPIDVDDEDWARRSQEHLKPITVGLLTIVPSAPSTQHPARSTQPTAPSTQHPARSTRPPAPSTAPGTRHQAPSTLVIQPSMGFGTGHHATTRLCLHALQALDLADRFVLDVGTGSGVLAIAAVRLGAARAMGIDYDADAIHAANENLTLNQGVDPVRFRVADLSAADLPAADVVTANLTGAVLIRSAARLLDLIQPHGTLIVSGLLEEERDDVVRAFGDAGSIGTSSRSTDAGSQRTRPTSSMEAVGWVLLDPPLVWEQHEDGWVALAMKRS